MICVKVAVSAGASFFKIDQDLVSDVTFTGVYPYDTAEFSSATLTRVAASKAGYNAGADVTWKLSRRWGVGGLLRFSRARIPLVLNTTDTITARVGGLQAGAGLRYVF